MTVEPKPEDAPVNMDIHPGQEFNYGLGRAYGSANRG